MDLFLDIALGLGVLSVLAALCAGLILLLKVLFGMTVAGGFILILAFSALISVAGLVGSIIREGF